MNMTGEILKAPSFFSFRYNPVFNAQKQITTAREWHSVLEEETRRFLLCHEIVKVWWIQIKEERTKKEKRNNGS